MKRYSVFSRARIDTRWLARLRAALSSSAAENGLSLWSQALAGASRRLVHLLSTRALPAKELGATHESERDALAVGTIAAVGLSTLDLDDLLGRLTERMVQISGASAGAILLLDEREAALKPGAYYGLSDEDLRSFRVPLGRGFAGRVAAERKPIAILDVRRDRTFLNPYLKRRGIRSVLGVPLLVEGRLLGVAHVDRLDVHSFTPGETTRLQEMAAQASLAVYHAILREQLRLANEELMAANRRLETLLHTIPAGVAILEAPSGRVVTANRAAEMLWGHPPLAEAGLSDLQTAYGLHHRNGDAFDQGELPMVRSIVRGETVVGKEMLVRRPDGKESIVLVSSAPLRGPDERIEGAIAVFQDTSGLELEKIKDEFVAVTAHELFTPLTIVKGTAQLLSRRAAAEGLDDDFKAGLRTVDGRANWMTYLIRKMIDAAELQLGPLCLRKGPVDLVSLAHSSVRRFQAMTDRHEIVVVSEEERLVGNWDRERIDRVLANLLENAITYSPGGGRIEVEVKRTNLRNLHDPHSGPCDHEWALVRVTDHGLGIAKDQQAHLFRRFYRAGSDRYQDSAGLGLGLYIANRYVSAHGGHVFLESEPSKGSSFYFSLPMERDMAVTGEECCTSA